MRLAGLVVVALLVAVSLATPLDRRDPPKEYTFTQPQSFLELRPVWPLTAPRQLSFRFRTRLSHVLLVHHGLLNPPASLHSYDLYVKLEKGQIRIIHIFNDEDTSITVGKGLSQDEWHDVRISINPNVGQFEIQVDNDTRNVILPGLAANPNYSVANKSVDSVLFFGGLNPNDTVWSKQYGYAQFVGCLGDIHLKVNNDDVPDLRVFSYAQIDQGCINSCKNDLCLHNSICINHYSKTSCDCFGTGHEGPVCGTDDISIITLRGYSYASYKIYEWVEKTHSDQNRISLSFRTNFDDSVLFYGLGETPTRNFVAASLKNGSVHVSIDFGDGLQEVTLGKHLSDDWWHNLTVLHNERTINIVLDGSEQPGSVITVNGPLYHLHLDPKFYIGGVPIKMPKLGLKSENNFVGSIREAYFGTVSILERLRNKHTDAIYHGLFPPEWGYREVHMLPVTFFYPESKIRLTTSSDSEFVSSLTLSLDFKTTLPSGVLAHSSRTADKDNGYWKLKLDEGSIAMTIYPSTSSNSSARMYELGERLHDGRWHQVSVTISNREIVFFLDYKYKKLDKLNSEILFSNTVYIGGSMLNPHSGFVGCMRQIKLNNKNTDPRNVVDSDQIEGGEISMDNCQLVDPCKRPGVCEHGGKCMLRDNQVTCDCEGTGYTGKTCHFSLYRRTCEELFLVGYRKPGVYMIDIDGNGPHPPAPVSCDIDTQTHITTTTIATNIPNEMVVRNQHIASFRVEVTYRNFTADMLQTLIKHSKNCTQIIKFDCFKAPLGLRSYTWFRTSYKNNYVSSFGSKKNGYCLCGENRTCTNSSMLCNCDARDARWRYDVAEINNIQFLGVTEVFFLQPSDLQADGEGRFTLGPLKCVEMDTQQYVITFKTSDSFLEIPGWKSGDLAFSFRTSHKQAILFVQPALFATHSHFQIMLINENELVFEFSVRGKLKRVKVGSQQPLNSGDWQQVWVDYDKHHVRFTINTESKVIDLEKNEEFGPFEGPLYVAGAPKEYLKSSPIREGFIGCLRGLVINEEVANLYSYLSPRTPQVITGCKPSCDPNPCKNGATCHEKWGMYNCECSNPLAHSGIHCEININQNGVTFVTENGHFHELYYEQKQTPTVLTEDILANIRTYESRGLLLYAHDHYSNFVQLHVQDGNQLVFTFNSMRHIVEGVITYEALTQGKPVQILVDREPEHTILKVDHLQKIINHPLRLVDRYRQNPWVAGQELEKVKPPRPPVEPKPYLQLFLGALDKSNMESNLVGFVGCLTGLKFGNESFDLMRLVDENPGTENFRKACLMSCDRDPCKNDGYCIEDWRNMVHRCDCTGTSYYGKSCEQDVGGAFDGKSYYKHIFVPDSSTYQKVQVQMAFSTPHLPDSSGPRVLMFINSKVDERNYILIALTPDGMLRIEEDDGSRRVISALVNTTAEVSFTDGRRHWILYHRSMDKVELSVDGISIKPETKLHDGTMPDTADRYGGDANDVVMIGGMDIIDNRFLNFKNYKGCLSNVIVVIDSFNFYPLETAYNMRPGFQNLELIGQITKTACASFTRPLLDSNTPTGFNLTEFVGPKWIPPPPLMIPFTEAFIAGKREQEAEIAMANTNRIGLVMGIFLMVIIISLAVYMWRVDWKDKQYRYEEGVGENHAKKQANSKNDGIRAVSFHANKNGYAINPYALQLRNPLIPEDGWQSEGRKLEPMEELDSGDEEDDDEEELEEPEEDEVIDEESEEEEEEQPEAEDISQALIPEEPVPQPKKSSSQELKWEPQTAEDGKSMDADDETDSDNDSLRDNRQSIISEAPSLFENTHPPAENHTSIAPIPDEISTKAEVYRRPLPKVPPLPPPLYLSDDQRTYSNPISYLGGPKINPRANRDSITSVISLD